MVDATPEAFPVGGGEATHGDGAICRTAAPDRRSTSLSFQGRHLGVEAVLAERSWAQAAVLVARLDAVASLAREIAFARAVERLGDVTPSPRGAALREVALALEQLVAATQFFTELADLYGGTTLAAARRTAREQALEVLELWTGARVHHDLTVCGGVRADIPADWPAAARRLLDELWRWARVVDARLLAARSWQRDTRGLAVLTRPEALAAGLTGPSLRASADVGADAGTGTGTAAAAGRPAHPGGDVFARVWVRLQDVRWQCRRVRAVLDDLPAGPVANGRAGASRDGGTEAGTHGETGTEVHGTRFPDRVAAGEADAWVEHAGGLFGALVVSAGGRRPWRLRLASPSVAASLAAARCAATAPAGLADLAALSFWPSVAEAAR